jgi:hypothetical protein
MPYSSRNYLVKEVEKSMKHIIDNHLKSNIFIDVDALWTSGREAQP